MSLSPEAVDFSQLTPVAPPTPPPSLETAARQARELVAAAEAEASRIRSEAFAAGHAEGVAVARAETSARLAPTADAIASTLAGLQSLEASAADRVEVQAVELAVQVAERVVSGVIAVEPSRVVDVVRGALRTLVERERIVVLVHPEDVSLVREALPEVEVHEERRVTRGGAVVRTALGEVDATLETKLGRARDAMMAELGSAPS